MVCIKYSVFSISTNNKQYNKGQYKTTVDFTHNNHGHKQYKREGMFQYPTKQPHKFGFSAL